MPPKIGAHVALGGKTRTLRYTAPSLLRIQEELGGADLHATMEAVSRVSFRHIIAMVWGGLLHDMPDLTIEEAAEMIQPPMQRLVTGITDALGPWVELVPEGEEEATPAKKKGPTV